MLQATCTVRPEDTVDSIAESITDYLGNHEEELEALISLNDCFASDITHIIKQYLKTTPGDPSNEYTLLTIQCDTEDFCNDTEVAEFLCNHIAYFMTSPSMLVTWVTIDSREGLSINSYTLGMDGEAISLNVLPTVTQPPNPSTPTQESIYVRLDFHEESGEPERDGDHAYLYETLDQLMKDTCAFKSYKILTDEDKPPSHF
jgi:hypothetical protein